MMKIRNNRLLSQYQTSIQNLSANVNSGGQTNGNITGSNIVSTQKLKSGVKSEYIADKSICLLPGFESVPVFNAEIKPRSGFQWNYILKDHLGNTRVLFTDKNGDGLIRQDASEALNEVLSLSNYSPFGLELGGSHQNLKQQFDYKFNGKQDNGFSGLTDFGARYLDKYLGKWTTFDPHTEDYYSLSANNFVANNPILFTDPDGKNIGFSKAGETTDKKTGVTTITYNINVSMAVMNSSGMSSKDYQNAVKNFTNQLIKSLSNTFNAGDKTQIAFQAGDINVRSVSSMSDVKSTDHLMVVVDDITGKDAKGGRAGGLAELGGKIAYVEAGNVAGVASNMVHEFGHNMGLSHNFQTANKADDGEANHMGYSNIRNQFVGVQLLQTLNKFNSRPSQLNIGNNYEILKQDYQTNGHTTQQLPLRYNVGKGGKIPKTLKN